MRAAQIFRSYDPEQLTDTVNAFYRICHHEKWEVLGETFTTTTETKFHAGHNPVCVTCYTLCIVYKGEDQP